MVTVDGVDYNAAVINLKRSADFLDSYAERTMDGILHRELIGVYFNYELDIGFSQWDRKSYDAFYDKITEKREFHEVKLPFGRNYYHTFTAYVSGVSDKLFKDDDGNFFWKGLKVKFIAKSPAR